MVIVHSNHAPGKKRGDMWVHLIKYTGSPKFFYEALLKAIPVNQRTKKTKQMTLNQQFLSCPQFLASSVHTWQEVFLETTVSHKQMLARSIGCIYTKSVCNVVKHLRNGLNLSSSTPWPFAFARHPQASSPASISIRCTLFASTVLPWRHIVVTWSWPVPITS